MREIIPFTALTFCGFCNISVTFVAKKYREVIARESNINFLFDEDPFITRRHTCHPNWIERGRRR